MTDLSLDFKKQGGLLPVIVTDFQTGQVLMLAYMNEEAYQKTLESKEMYYWSRSRNELWHKEIPVGIISMSSPSRQIVTKTLSSLL